MKEKYIEKMTFKIIHHGDCKYLGQYCYADSVENFLSMDEDQFISHMIQEYENVCSMELEQSEIESWKRSYRLVRDSFLNQLAAKDAFVIFEYVLPNKKYGLTERFCEQAGCRADIIILTKKIITVVEVKDRTKDAAMDAHFDNQAQKYKRKLQQFHFASLGMKIKVMLVLLQEENLSERKQQTWYLSPDGFKERVAISSIGAQAFQDPDVWIHSNWIWRSSDEI